MPVSASTLYSSSATNMLDSIDMCVPKTNHERKRKTTRSVSLISNGFTEQLRIEESTVKENDFELPLTLDEVMSEINKKYYEPALMNSVLKVLEDTGIISPSNPKKYVAWRSLKADLLTSLTAPYSSDAQLECYILWLVLVWTIDDIRDKFFLEDYGDSINDHEKVQRNLDIVRDTNDDILALVDSSAWEMPPLKHFASDDAVVKLARYLRVASLDCMDLSPYQEFVVHLDDHLKKGVTVSIPYVFSMMAGGPFPMSIADYEELRMKDSAGAMCVHLAGFTSYGNRVDKEILDKCLGLVTLHAAVLNDLFSYEKQIYREHDRFNYVCAVQQINKVTFDEATHVSVKRANECVTEHERLSRLVDPDDVTAQQILDTHRRWFTGHIVWVKKCGRYSSATSPFHFLRTVYSTMDSSLAPED